MGKILTDRQILAGTPDRYYSLVDGMSVGEKERDILKSVLDRNRTGTIRFVDPKTGETMRSIDWSDDASLHRDIRAQYLGMQLHQVLTVIHDLEYTVRFEER